MASACSRQSMQGNIALFFKKLMQYFLQYFVILKRLVSEIMKLLSLEIEKKIIATSQIIQHQKLLKLFTSQNNKK